MTGGTELLAGTDRLGVLAAATLVVHLNGYAIVLPFFMAVATHRASSARVERASRPSPWRA